MNFDETLSYLITWGLIGAVLFSLFVIFAFRSGIVYAARKKDGTYKDKIPGRGIMVMSGFLAMVIGFFVTANYFGLFRRGVQANFGTLFLLNLSLYLILFTYDTLVIDGLVLGYWRPGFLNLSDELGGESMRRHILVSLPVGLASGLGLAGLTAGISWLLFMA